MLLSVNVGTIIARRLRQAKKKPQKQAVFLRTIFLGNYKGTIYLNQVIFAEIKKLYEKLFYIIKTLCKPWHRTGNFFV